MYEEHSRIDKGRPGAGKESPDVRHVAAVIACDFVQGAVELNSVSVLGAFAKVRLATVSCVMSVCPSVRPSVLIEQLGPHLTDFRDLRYLSGFSKICRENSSFIKI